MQLCVPEKKKVIVQEGQGTLVGEQHTWYTKYFCAICKVYLCKDCFKIDVCVWVWLLPIVVTVQESDGLGKTTVPHSGHEGTYTSVPSA